MEPGKFQLEDKENNKCQPIEIIEAYLGRGLSLSQ